MLDVKESLDLYDSLAGTMRELDLGWLVEQVNQRIAAGKTIRTKEVRPYAEVLRPRRNQADVFGDEAPYLARELVESKATTFIATEEFTPTERLLLLVAAIERVVIDTYEMERVLPDMLGSSERGATGGSIEELEGSSVDASFSPGKRRGTSKPERVQFSSEMGEIDPIEVSEAVAPDRAAAIASLSRLIAQLREEIRA